jgi:PAS domain S-box-containing protein
MTDNGQTKTILLVEDEALIAMQEARQLQKEGYAVTTVYSGEDAIATVQTAQPPIDLILMDIDLGRGRMDGTQAAQTILQTQDIPIVFLSSHTEPDIVARTEQITSYGYVVKNLGITVLAASIKMAFKLHAAHQALRASEERLRLAHKATNDVVWDWDVIHDTQQWNEAGRAVFGWSEIVEHSVNVRWWVERVHPDDRQRVDAGFVKVVNDPGVDYWQDEYRFQKADGSYADVMDRGYVLRDASGKAIRMIGAMRDISKDKRAEEALTDEATRRRILVEQSSDGIVILDQDGHVYESNQKFADMLGYPLDEMRTLNIFDWEYLYPRERVIEMIRTIDEKGDHFETRHRRRDGSLYDVEISTNAALFAGQKLIFCVCRDITDRKQAEEALEQARNTLAEAQKVAYLGSFEYIAATRTTVWSEEEYRIYGLDPTGPSPAYDMMLQKCIHPDDRTLLHETFTKAMQSRSVYELEHRIVRPDRSVRWVYDRAHPYFDGQGELVRYVGATLDITDRKRAEEKLRESEAQLALVFNNTSDMHLLLRVDSEDRFIAQAINRSYANVTDLLSPGSSRNIVGKDRHDFLRDIGFLPEEIEREIPLYHQAVETHAEVQYEIEFPTPHGNFTFAVSIVPVLDQQGNCTHVLWSGHDITERKRVDNALRESEEKYRLLAETSNALISEIDTSGKFLYVNPKHKEVLGYEADEMIGRFAFEFGNPVEEQKAKEQLVKSLDEEKVQSNEWLFKDKGGNWKRLVCHSNTYIDSKGETHITVYSFDITERKQAENALRQALDEKEILMRELQHRVKNSLNIVASLISLEEMNLSDEQARAMFANTRSRIESISAVYEQLYHSSGIDQINLRHYIRSLVEGLSRSYLSGTGKVTIETQLDDVQLDIKRAMPLGIIINELVTNALKYAFPAGHAPHGGQGVIRVELSTSGGSVNLCVADNGIGFPVGKEHHAGTGLGLVEMLTQQLEGQLTIESAQGITARVIFGYGPDR